MRFSDLTGRRVVVWGFGREGQSVTDRCLELGIDVTVAEPDLPSGQDSRIRYAEEGRAALLDADVVIKSPGVPVTSGLFAELAGAGKPITSLTDLWLSDNAARAVAVTGTKGKSTTASLIHHLLDSLGRRSILRGNIGSSVLLEPTPPAEVVVLEVSSYQAQSVTVSPRIVVVTSLFPEHLNWHGSEEAYYNDKLNLLAHGPELVIAHDEPGLLRRIEPRMGGGTSLLVPSADTVHADESGDIVWPDGTRWAAQDLPLLGRHHAQNIALALLAVQQFGGTAAGTRAALESFRPLPHRMERVASTDGRVWIDDGLATAPEAVVASLRSLPDDAVAVIVGGADRGLDFGPLLRYLEERPDVVLELIGPAGRRIAEESGQGLVFPSFDAAAEWARSDANPARVVLLSPGAPSYDEFRDFEARSAAFRSVAAR